MLQQVIKLESIINQIHPPTPILFSSHKDYSEFHIPGWHVGSQLFLSLFWWNRGFEYLFLIVFKLLRLEYIIYPLVIVLQI